ncbi:MAG: ATP-dependent Clp protease ATP-binding subunit [Microcystis sp. M048S1]|uniref:ATP-dependent Clp protease ATP-binding subunit n=1 Tax=unclassified Microcystis TaxID=2643300 RepID=UPI00118F9664|nr:MULTISPECIES: ATP-dependent Clp protease ATP-binding subunit [unclassified Microcystis]MCA2901777.1 ATP-dependent Clp protease ATP-binding subunit [Microcystis sp. M035S1]MCA2721814.1 ATP-dependent Clp protease ATP-binding subunit [Microcystis sp. M176S2]MCA2728158.1 ATP-dependent Clp protease ATP-binding subunit [Microcystis sp. M166S2]MCA2732040.1 ATP-dependent Clp protease ATP-binding subunit [Microcystis sp. M162S2]MCA2746389.1 ATP-dependent Clp protease ATP-binding subunit [Microcystis
MFEYFNQKAIKAVMFAQEEARRTGHSVVGTEHLLLGLIGEATATAALILKDLKVTLHESRRLIEGMTGRGTGYSPVNIPFTPKAKKMFEQAFQEARQLGENAIAPEHLLLAITSDPESLAAKILIMQGVDLIKLRGLLIKNAGEKVASGRLTGMGDYKDQKNAPQDGILSQYSRNLSQEVKNGKIDPVIGREPEIERVVQILGRRTKSNPILLGAPGVGKTAIAEGLAQRIHNGDIPDLLQDKQVIALDMGSLLAGTRFRGDFEERLKGIVEEVRKSGNIILFIDEIHTLVGAGSMGGAMDASNLLKPALARGELQCLGATTLDEYKRHIERDAALERRFQPVMVGEPTKEQAIEILRGLKATYEDFHQVKYDQKAIEAAVNLSSRYINDRFLPDKAIDLLDEAGSRTHLRYSLQSTSPAEVREESPLINPESLIPVVDAEEIAQIVAAWTGIPVSQLTETESESLLNLECQLHERIIGQQEAVNAVSRAIRRARVNLKNPNRPIASFIFAGPTGVGKTELTKALAKLLFGSESSMIRLDMSEFMESHTVSKLIGAPPGYIGYNEGGQLTEAVRRQPYRVVLFDEIEKAHPDVFNLLLQLLEDGHLTDSQGRRVDFKNTLIIMTSNIGSKVIEKGGNSLGFEIADDFAQSRYQQISNRVTEELKQYFRPEFLNRLDEIIVFRQLTREEVTQIADILIADLAKQLTEKGISVEVTAAFKDLVINEGYDPSYGARPLRRALTRRLEDSLAVAMLSGKVNSGDHAILDVTAEAVVTVSSHQRSEQSDILSQLQLQPVG